MRHLCFGSGPCAKRRDWIFPSCSLAGRSHRSKEGMNLIRKVLHLQRKILGIPDDYLMGICPASCTGGMELLMWNLLGAKPVDILAHCVFSNHWAHDVVEELKIPNITLIKENFPRMADVSKVNFSHDLVFCLSSTTSGVSFRDTNWISADREGLTICDASSGAFIVDVDWKKLDAVAFSWQKALGGEGGFGVVVLSPRAVERLKTFRPNRAIPRIFRIINNGEVNMLFFDGATINTPSMLCFQDVYETLTWVDQAGGLPFLHRKVEKNYQTVCDWLKSQSIFKFLVEEKFRAHHIACLDINSEKYQRLSKDAQWKFLHQILDLAAEKKCGYDFLGHALTEPHIRIWCGPTIESEDLQKFLPKLLEIYKEVASANDLN